tara:strand:- start:140 stop:2200 length:2061 start_codon:yes stop_codon:yes gene_type:complete
MADTNLKVQIKFQATGDRELARAFKTAAIATEKLKKANEKLNNETKKTRKGFFQISNEGRLLSNTFATIRSKLLLMSFAFTLVTATVGKFIQKSAQFEKVKVRLNAMFGSVEAGTKAFNTFNKIAATTPFTLEDVVEAGASLKAFGADAEALIKPVADLAAFMGTNAAEAASALGRAFAGGAGAADILRERGILQLVRDSQGIEDLSKITLPEFRRALEKTITDPSVGVAGATDKLSKTMSGLFSNLADSFSRLSAAVGDVATGGMFRTGVEAMTGLFGRMAEALNEINKTDIEKIDEIRKSLGMPVITRGMEEESESLTQIADVLKGIIKPGRDSAIVFNELQIALEDFEKAQSTLDLFGDKGYIGTLTKGKAGQNLRKAKKLVISLNEEFQNIQKLIIAESGIGFGEDPFSAFAGLDLIDAFAPIDFQPRGLFPSNEDLAKGLQVFTDDLSEQVESIEKSKLNRVFESFLELEQLFQGQLVDGFMNSFNEIISLQKANLDQRVNNELKALRKTDKFRNASMEQRQTMEDDVRAKFAKDQKRIFQMQKAMSISQVIIDTATAINKLMAVARATMNPAVIAAARGMSGVMGAFSAAQIATISKQQAPAFARGGSFITGGQQMIMVGDNPGGRERVDITPLSSPDFGDAGGSGSINVNIMGNVIGTQEFVRDNLLPEIENSIRRNLA